jgi:hypothetical protein
MRERNDLALTLFCLMIEVKCRGGSRREFAPPHRALLTPGRRFIGKTKDLSVA